MKPDIPPTIYSFIIRFVVEDAPEAAGHPLVYHGAIRHIQSAEELNFNEWGQAVEFMRRFIPIDQMNDPNE